MAFHGRDRITRIGCGDHLVPFSIVLTALLTIIGQVEAGKIEAKSVSFADVSAAIGSAKDGDTVIVPTGTATWTTPLNITDNITLQGAGAGSTVIIDEVPRRLMQGPRGEGAGPHARPGRFGEKASGRGHGRDMATKAERGAVAAGRGSAARGEGRGSYLISIHIDKDLPFRMTGFTFQGGNVNTQKNSNGVIRISGNCHLFRIDHCRFDGLYGTSLSVAGFLWGVVDHCQFNCLKGRTTGPVEVKHREWNGKDWGHGSWADDPYWGSEKFVFVEDNTFEFNGKGAIDSFEGARFVVRHNHMHNCGLVMHGTEGQGRGAKQLEEYNNTYVFDQPGSAGQIRSGCIITHDNTWTNVARGHVLQDFRYYNGQDTKWGIANGQNIYDLNDPNGTIGYWAAGTHTGPNDANILTDATKNWTTNQWYTPALGVAYIIRNRTKEAAGIPAQQSWILGNTSNTVTFSHVTFQIKQPLAFNTGDRYEIWKIERLLDQPGVGKGDLLTGAGTYGSPTMATPKAWPHQVSEPCYSWNNTDGNGKALNLGTGQASIKEGRDFFNGTPKPGYKPYTYPHPLVRGAAVTSK